MQVIDGNKDDNALLGFLNYDKIKTGKMRKQSEIWQQKRGCRALTLPILLKPIIRAQAMTWRLSTTRQPAKNGLTKVRRKNGYGYRCNAYKFIRRQNERVLHCKCGKIVRTCVGGKYKNQYRTAVYADNATAIINANYEIPEKEPFNPDKDASKLWTNINGITTDTANAQAQYKWYGTAFGKNSSPSNYVITQSTEGGLTFTVKETTSKGKIESSNDSIAAVFIQVPFKTAFSVSATAKVVSYGGNQAGFGLMVRDDIYIGSTEVVSSNYVTAGCYGTSTKAVMGYARNGGSLAASSNKVDYPAANSEYLLTLARSSQSITAKIGNYSYSAVSDFDLAVSDSEYVYVCLWATRGTEVKFSNISFTSNEWANA